MAIGNLICYLPILPKSTPIINIIRLDNKGVRPHLPINHKANIFPCPRHTAEKET